MDLGGAGLPQHAHHGPGGRAPHDGVVDHHQPLAGDGAPQRVELAAHALGPLGLIGHDERPADVAVLDQTLAVADAAAPGVPLGGRQAGVGHAHDHVGRHRSLLGQQLAHADPGAVQLLAVQAAVGPGQVHELEQAQLGIDPLRPATAAATGGRRRR